eukprot:gene2196-2500_t
MDHLRQCITNIATDSKHIQYFWQDISTYPFGGHSMFLSFHPTDVLLSPENGNVNREAVHEDDTKNVESNGDYADSDTCEPDDSENDDVMDASHNIIEEGCSYIEDEDGTEKYARFFK